MGTVARIVKLLKMGEDNYSLVVQGPRPVQGG